MECADVDSDGVAREWKIRGVTFHGESLGTSFSFLRHVLPGF